MILVDTSVWIDFINRARTPASDYLKDEADAQRLPFITEPVIMELLAGATPGRVGELEILVDGLPLVPVEPMRDYRSAAHIHRGVRRSGRTVRQLNDCLIAAVALRTGATLVHKDVDFEVIAEIFPLDHLSLR